MKRFAILGASGHGKVVADIAVSTGWEEVVFFDDAWPNVSSNACWPVLGASEDLIHSLDTFDGVTVAIGNNKVRAEKFTWLKDFSAPIFTLVHPAAVVSQYSKLGRGLVIMPGVIVNAWSTIGDGVILNTGCSIDHDCVIGDYAHISPGARLAGGVCVGEQSWVGIGASVIQCVVIGDNSTIGAGSVVVKDVSSGKKVVGVPARSI